MHMKNKSDALIILACSFVAGGLTQLMLRSGLYASPDSWTYWEGSISLLESGHYTRFLGGTITEWPPLFSAYLALVQILTGQTGAALSLAMSVLSFLNVFAWGAYITQVFPGGPRDRTSWIGFAGSMAFTVLFVPLCSFTLLAHFLLLAFVAVAYGTTIRVLSSQTTRGFLWRCLFLGCTLSVALLTHNSALVYVAAAAVIVLAGGRQPLSIRFVGSCIAAGAATAPWLGYRATHGQMSSHPPGSPLHEWWQYAAQSLVGIGDFFLSSSSQLWLPRAAIGTVFIFAITGAFVLRKRLRVPTSCVTALGFTMLSYLFLFIVFNLTWIDSGLSGRFLWYIPLAVVPVLLRILKSRPSVLLLAVLAVAAVPLARDVKWGVRGLVPPLTANTVELPDNSIRPWYFLTEGRKKYRPVGTKQVVPPTYPWMQRWQHSDLPDDERRRVHIVQEALHNKPSPPYQ